MNKRGLVGAFVVVGLIILTGTLTSAPNKPDTDLSFRLEIEGVDAGEFESVEGLSIDLEVIEYQDGADILVRKIPGRLKYGDVTLRKGWVSSSILNNWIEQARSGTGDYERLTVAIVLYESGKNSGNGQEIKRWICHGCFFSSWKLSAFPGEGNEVLTEEVVITIEWFDEA